MLVSGNQLSTMGTQAFGAMLQQSPPVDSNSNVVKYVSCVSQPVVDAVAKRHEDAPKEWRLAVINDPTPNAFALPGGNIGVHTGMLKVAKTDDELAAVIGHELGHVLANHSGERLSQQLIAQGGMLALQGFALSKMEPGTQQYVLAALGLGAQVGLLLPWSRGQESESDTIGLHLMAQAGYDPNQAVSLWQHMAEEAKGKEPPEFLSTHPSPARRIQAIGEQAPKIKSEYQVASRSPAADSVAASRCQRPSEQEISAMLGQAKPREQAPPQQQGGGRGFKIQWR